MDGYADGRTGIGIREDLKAGGLAEALRPWIPAHHRVVAGQAFSPMPSTSLDGNANGNSFPLYHQLSAVC